MFENKTGTNLNLRRRKNTKKDIKFNEVLVRFYDSELMGKLSEAFKNGNYESKSGLITELTEHGLTSREQAQERRIELDTASVGIEERLSALEKQYAEFAKTTYVELKTLRKENNIAHKVLGAVYYLLQGIYFNESIVFNELDSGFYDTLPARFGSTV